MTACGFSASASSNFFSASGCIAQSSCKIHSHSFSAEVGAGSVCIAAQIASPKPDSRSRVRTGIFAPLSSATEESVEPVSTASI